MPFSRGSFQPRNPTEALCTAGGLFTTKLPWKFFGYCHCSVTQLCPTLWTPWTAARKDSLFITNSWSLHKLGSIELVMPSNHLIPCWPLLLPPSIFPSITVFSSKSVLRIRWAKFWSFSLNISPSNEYSVLISFRITGWISLKSKGLSKLLSNTRIQKHQFFSTQLSLWSNSHIHT